MKTAAPGPITRRSLLAGASLLITAPVVMGQPAPVVTRRLNNVMIAVSDLSRSLPFYSRLFGAPVQAHDAAVFRVGVGPHFFALVQTQNGMPPGFLSYGLTVDDFDPARQRAILSGLGARAEVTEREGTPELWTYDPDNIRIQLQHTAYGHGTGAHGEILPLSPRGSAAFALRGLSHVTLTNANGQRSKDFYEKVFAMPVQSKQGPNIWGFTIGTGPDCVVFNVAADNPAAKTGINHVCFTIADFDANNVMGILVNNGLEPVENGAPARPLTCYVRLRQRANNGGGPTYPLGTAELYLSDPDNIRLQIQDALYCGGSGRLGEICP